MTIEKRVFEKTLRRLGFSKDDIACVDVDALQHVVFALSEEINEYRGNIEHLNSHIEKLTKDNQHLEEMLAFLPPSTLEAVQDNTIGEIIKALSDNGYNNMSISISKN